jgi:hypothetical protein
MRPETAQMRAVVVAGLLAVGGALLLVAVAVPGDRLAHIAAVLIATGLMLLVTLIAFRLRAKNLEQLVAQTDQRSLRRLPEFQAPGGGRPIGSTYWIVAAILPVLVGVLVGVAIEAPALGTAVGVIIGATGLSARFWSTRQRM